MAMTLRLDDAAADALRRLAEREQRPAEDIARQAIREHVERAVSAPAGEPGVTLAVEIDRVRADAAFVDTLESLATRDREILDRLAESRILTLAEAMVVAERVTGIDATTLVRASRVDLLDSALHAPQAGFGDDDFYPEFATKAAVLCARIALNHPLPDGNKRLAWQCLTLFCALNGRDLHVPTDEAVTLMLAVAAGEVGEEQLADRVRARLPDPT